MTTIKYTFGNLDTNQNGYLDKSEINELKKRGHKPKTELFVGMTRNDLQHNISRSQKLAGIFSSYMNAVDKDGEFNLSDNDNFYDNCLSLSYDSLITNDNIKPEVLEDYENALLEAFSEYQTKSKAEEEQKLKVNRKENNDPNFFDKILSKLGFNKTPEIEIEPIEYYEASWDKIQAKSSLERAFNGLKNYITKKS